MRHRIRWGLCLGVVAICGAAGSALAGSPYETRYVGPAWGGFGTFPSIYSTESIPYFAEFPPVYYSHPVARTYGYSPYAYPPGVITPRRPRPAETSRIPSLDRHYPASCCVAAAEPLRIKNPYVDAELPEAPDDDVEFESLTDRVQVIQPAAVVQSE